MHQHSTTRLRAVFTALLMASCDPPDNAPDDTAEDPPGGEAPEVVALGLGDTDPAIAAAYEYLSHYGYFPNPVIARSYPGWEPVVAEAPAEPDTFDEAMESALLLFQRAHGLEETGLLDAPTRALIGKPRCGYPDYYEATEAAPYSPRYAFLGNKWPYMALKYAFTAYTADTSTSAQRSAVIAAMNTWAAVAPSLSFSETGGADIQISFVPVAHGDGYDFAPETLAHGFSPGGGLGGDLHFNDQTYQWGAGGQTQDIQSVAVHELGHTLGLGHSASQAAVMYAYYTLGSIKRTLDADDVAGIRALYSPVNWVPLGGELTSDPAVASWGSGRIDVFARGTDNALWHKWYQNGWSGWESLGGTLTSSPAAVSWGPGRIDVFARGTDNALWHKWYQNGWSGWESLGGGLTSGPAVASWSAGRLDVFVVGTDSALWHKWFDGGWSGWESLGGGLTSDPTAASWGAGRLDVFARGTDNALWHKWYQNGWSGWESLGGGLTSSPGVSSWGAGRLDVFVRGTDNAMWHKYFAGGWSGWEWLSGVLKSGPDAVSWGPARVDAFVVGTDGQIFQAYYDSKWH